MALRPWMLQYDAQTGLKGVLEPDCPLDAPAGSHAFRLHVMSAGRLAEPVPADSAAGVSGSRFSRHFECCIPAVISQVSY